MATAALLDAGFAPCTLWVYDIGRGGRRKLDGWRRLIVYLLRELSGRHDSKSVYRITYMNILCRSGD